LTAVQVTSHSQDASFSRFLPAASQDLAEHLDVQRAPWEANDVECRAWLGAHRVDIADGVRRRDLTEDERVVDDRCEEVDGVDDRQIGAQPKHAGIVVGLRADDDIRVMEGWKVVKNLRQVGWPELGGATGRFDVLRETHCRLGHASPDNP